MSKDELQGRSDVPQTLEDFMAEIKKSKSDAKTFALKLREMVPRIFFPFSFAQLHALLQDNKFMVSSSQLRSYNFIRLPFLNKELGQPKSKNIYTVM